ncbi:MAG: GntR family transcriptional regulator [Anaerolineales bacterium]
MLTKPKSITQQIREQIWERVRRGEFDANGRLPGEDQLALEFNVSRATIHSALDQLVNQGLLIRRHGDGTYVNRHLIDITTQLNTVWEFTQLIKASGKEPSIQLIQRDHIQPTPTQAEALEISPDTSLIRFSRLFYADEKPVIYSINMIPETIVSTPIPDEAARLSILTILEQYCGQSFGYAIADISAVMLDDHLTEILQSPAAIPLLCLNEIFYSSVGLPLMMAENYYNDKIIRLNIVRARP